MKQLFISDLDGTLLNNRGVLSEETKRGLNLILEKGVLFTLATARNAVSVKPLFEGIPLSLPIIAGGGAYLTDLDTGKHLHMNAIPSSVAEQVFSALVESGHTPFTGSNSGEDHLSYFEGEGNEGMQWYLEDRRRIGDRRLRKIDDICFFSDEAIISFVVIDRREVVQNLKFHLEVKFPGVLTMHVLENLYSRGWFWLTIHHRNSTKVGATAVLIAELGITPDQVTVFGDNVNDLDLFDFAGTSLAVANAEECVKERATLLIGSNEENSVIHYILESPYWRSK